MKLTTKIFSSKIARRIFVLFVSCALVPILCLSIISYVRVTKQLKEQSFKLLKQSVTGYAYSVYERLTFLETELQFIASSIKASLNGPGQIPLVVFNERLASRFKAAAFFNTANGYVPIYKEMNNLKKPNVIEMKHINAGNTAIFMVNRSGSFPGIMMVRLVNPRDLNAGYLIGEINPSYLWGIDQGNTLPPDTELCVLDESENIIFSSLSNEAPFPKKADLWLKNSVSGQFELVLENKKHLASYRRIFMSRLFLVDAWTVILSQSKADVFAPMSDFKTIFPAVVLMSLWVVLILSIYNIRKSLVPLELLKKGTHRIAMKNFDCRVDVKSGDEFEELAMDFNEMADQLNSQFKTLETKAEIDRAILSSLDAKIIVETIIHGIYDWFDCDSVAISLMESNQGNTARLYSNIYGHGKGSFETSIEFRPYDLETFHTHPEY
ncbi:MAG: HAMP domain-containing protein, partial [Desulfobacterales bacterium]|nr:HAMP domain-containing protein [Desulfobacterales bacterium]